MCTIGLAVDVLPDAPIALAATREEARDRPADPPAVRWVDPGPATLAPLDLRAGGTWIGVNASGLCVAVANAWTADPVSGERSRGRLVRDALGAHSVEAALESVQRALERDRYAPFRLVVASGPSCRATVLEWPGGMGPPVEVSRQSLAAGVHAVTNVGVDEAVGIPDTRAAAGERQRAVGRRVRSALDPQGLSGDGGHPEAWLDRAAAVLADHEVGACVHADPGTRSASVLAIDDAGRVTYRYADGRPCRTPFRTVWSGRPVVADGTSEG